MTQRLAASMQGAMVTYKQIQEWVRQQYGWTPKSCWIAHCKELRGLARRDAPNRRGAERRVPCPRHKRDPIFSAFRHFMMLTALTGMVIFSVVLGATQDGGTQTKGQTTEIQELRQAAEQGDPEAQFKLGAAHADDLGDTEAIAWLRAAANQGHFAAQVTLASRYEGGIGVPQDHGEAIVWYRLAAEQDLTDSQAGPDTFESVMDLQMQAMAQYQLGGLYMEGLGVPRNLTTAAHWYRRAADHGLDRGRATALGTSKHEVTGSQETFRQRERCISCRHGPCCAQVLRRIGRRATQRRSRLESRTLSRTRPWLATSDCRSGTPGSSTSAWSTATPTKKSRAE